MGVGREGEGGEEEGGEEEGGEKEGGEKEGGKLASILCNFLHAGGLQPSCLVVK